MAFTDRKKQPQLWRTGANPFPTAEEVVVSVLAGIATNLTEKMISKAFAKLKIPRPSAEAAPPAKPKRKKSAKAAA